VPTPGQGFQFFLEEWSIVEAAVIGGEFLISAWQNILGAGFQPK
jgi:hypothetical protein